ncbi:rRNA maturation RNase YbeY [Acetobacteraceae bacterium]|nr:rRNA maturation RNase YbeY [Acetobacteraceae bacterium]
MLTRHMKDTKISFIFDVEDKRWHRYIPDLLPFAARICRHLQAVLPSSKALGEINVLFSNARNVKKLNYQFRHKNKSTNVLSFPAPIGSGGDIILSFEDVLKETQMQQKKINAHTAHLLVHGSLHLLDYTHDHPAAAREMENLETFILSFSNIPDPWRKANTKSSHGV